MKKALFAISLLLVLGLLVAGCSKSEVTTDPIEQENTGDDVQTSAGTEQTPEDYIEDEIIDENSSIEIGEMI